MMKVIDYSHTERDKIDGDVFVCEGGDLVLTGVVTGTLLVGRGGYAQINGTVGQLVVRDGGGARLDGTCRGDARNESGELTVTGTVEGSTYGYTATA